MAYGAKRGGFAPDARASRWKFFVLLGIPVLLVVGGYFLLARTRDMQRSPPRLIGSVWTTSVDGDTRVYFVTREDRAETRAYDSEAAYTYEHSYSIYTLHAHAGVDGSASAAVQIARIETTSPDFKKYQAYQTLPDGPGILGPQADVLWLWNNGPEARDLRTLEPVWSAQALATHNPQLAPALPHDPKYAKVIGPMEAMVVKATDARYFRIDRATGELQPVDEAAFAAMSQAYTKTADSAFDSLGPSGKSLRSVSVSGLIMNAVLDDGSWYALLTPNERTGLRARLGSIEDWNLRLGSIAETGSSLFVGGYKLEREHNIPRTTIQLDLASVAPVGNERFLMAGFLRRPGTLGAWTVTPSPAATATLGSSPPATAVKSYIVLHRAAIGDANPWMLTRIGSDGTRHWTRNTGLTELNHVCDGGTSVIMTGFTADSRPKGHWPERMIFVDESVGTLRTLHLASGELSLDEQ
ncbi:MAG: hypothetical protein H7210_03320 [Pyrinomonadaceae bacterium]|nr:hypothetical protein [Phycisphaerales bacterium]